MVTVPIKADYPWQARLQGLLTVAEEDQAVALGLACWDGLNGEESEKWLGVYNASCELSDRSPTARRVGAVVRECCRCAIAKDDQERPDFQPTVVGLSLKAPKWAKKVAKAAYKASRSPLVAQIAAASGVPGLSTAVVAYQKAMDTADPSGQGRAKDMLKGVAAAALKAGPGTPAAKALENVQKGIAVVKQIQDLKTPTPEAVRAIIADTAKVDLSKVAKQYGLKTTDITASAVSKLAKGDKPLLRSGRKPEAPKPQIVAPSTAPAYAPQTAQPQSYGLPACPCVYYYYQAWQQQQAARR